MKTLHNYLVRELAVAIGLSVGVFAFVLLLGQVIEQLQRLLALHGMSILTVFKLLPLLLPYVLMFSLPMGVMTAMMLVFGKLSADNELTALRASGLSLMQLIWPAFLMAACLSFFCLFLNTTLAPWCKVRFKDNLLMAVLSDPHKLLREKDTMAFGNIRINVDRIRGNRAENIRIFWLDDKGKVDKELRALSGTLSSDLATRKVFIDLKEVKVEIHDEADPTNPAKVRTGMEAGSYTLEMDASNIINQGSMVKKNSDLTLAELIDSIGQEREAMKLGTDLAKARRHMWSMLLDAEKRVSWALACFVFALLSIPLGIRTHRRETTANAAIALLLVAVYYFLTGFSGAWEDRSIALATMWLWLPNVLFAIVGSCLLWRVSRA